VPVRLFVGNLPYDATESELREHFSSAGQLSFIHLPLDRESGKPRGFAFVEFKEKAEADEAVRRFNNQPFKGRPLTINEARARDERPRTGAPAPRPSMFRPDPMAIPPMSEPPAKGDGGRKFGPDAAPRRRTKGKGGPKGGERVPKGPMREVVSSRFFGGDDDDDSEYDDLGEENFAQSAGENDYEHDA
jgi:cold-inducible RNA-binding protein